MAVIRIVDVTAEETFGLLPPCADPSFDHRTCDYWEDPVAGSKAHREAWLRAAAPPPPITAPETAPFNPFLREAASRAPAFNPFDPRAPSDVAPDRADTSSPGAPGPFGEERDLFAEIEDNPFAPRRRRAEGPPAGAPRKLGLLTRGLGIFGSYARILLVDDEPAAYCQFGPLSAYPRALRLRDLYPQLPAMPLPAVITCVATTRGGRRRGHALALVGDVCDELARRGFAAVEAYPEAGTMPDATSAATPAFWERAGFAVAVHDERFPVMRRDL